MVNSNRIFSGQPKTWVTELGVHCEFWNISPESSIKRQKCWKFGNYIISSICAYNLLIVWPAVTLQTFLILFLLKIGISGALYLILSAYLGEKILLFISKTKFHKKGPMGITVGSPNNLDYRVRVIPHDRSRTDSNYESAWQLIVDHPNSISMISICSGFGTKRLRRLEMRLNQIRGVLKA